MKFRKTINLAGISKKLLCIIMSISLCLMMVPHTLYTNKAYADNTLQPDVEQKEPEIVPLDHDMSSFGDFVYNAKKEWENKKSYTNNDFLHLLGCKVETAESVQKSAENDINLALIEHNIKLKDLLGPYVKDPKVDLTKTASIVSDDSVLEVTPVESEEVINNKVVREVKEWNLATKWNDTIKDTKKKFNLAINTKNTSYICTYENVPLISREEIKPLEIKIDTNTANGKISITPGQVKCSCNIDVKLEVTHINKNLSKTFGVTAHKINFEQVFKSPKIDIDNIEYNTWVGDDVLSFANLLNDDFCRKIENISVDETKRNKNIEIETLNNQEKKAVGYHVKAMKVTEPGEELHVVLHYFDKETKDEESCDICVTNVDPQKVTNIQPIIDKLKDDFDMREKVDQQVKIENELNNISIKAEDGTDLVVSPAVDMQIIKGTYPDLNSFSDTFVSLEEKALALVQGGSITKNYILDFGNCEFGIWVKAPQIFTDTKGKCPIKLFDGNDKSTEKTFDDWFTVNTNDQLITLKAKAEEMGNTVCNLVTNTQTYKFSSECNPVPADTPSSEDVRISVLIKNKDGVISKFETKDNEGLKLDKEVPSYDKYEVDYDSEESKSKIIDGNLFDRIKKFFNTIFSSEKITVHIYLSAVSGISEINISKKEPFDKNISWKYVKENNDYEQIVYNKENHCFDITFEKNVEEDLNKWYIQVVNEAGTESEWENFVKGEDTISKLVIDEEPPTCKITTDLKDKEHQTDNPEIYNEKVNFKITVTDPYFQYTRKEKFDDSLFKYTVTADPFQSDNQESTIELKYSKFHKLNGTDNEWVVYADFSLPKGSDIKEIKIEISENDNIKNLLGKDAEPYKEENNPNNLSYWNGKEFFISTLSPKAHIKWETEHKEYNNIAQVCNLVLEEWNAGVPEKSNNLVDVWYKLNGESKTPIVVGTWSKVENQKYAYQIQLKFGDDKDAGKDNGRWEFDGLYNGKGEAKDEAKDGLNRTIKTDEIKDVPEKVWDKSFIFDNVAPQISVAYEGFNLKDAGHKYGDVKYFDEQDPTVNITVEEQYSWNNNTEDSTVKVTSAIVDGQNDDGIIKTTNWEEDPAKVAHNKQISFNGKNGKPDGRYNFAIEGFEDKAGNECVFDTSVGEDDGKIDGKTFTSDKFDFDTKAPEIKVSWGYDRQVYHGKYYNQARTAKLNILERNWIVPSANESQSSKINAITDGNRVIDENPNWNNEANYMHSISVPFSGQGDCSINLNSGDYISKLYDNPRSNHKTSNAQPDFVQDWTVPTINVNWDNNNVINDMYYTQTRNAIITIDERYFNDENNPPEIVVNPINYPGNDGSSSSYNLDSTWSHNGNLHTKNLSFPNEGAFAVEVVGNDLAMNNLNPYSQSKFILDWTKPVINITGVENRQAYKDTAIPNVSVSDVNVSDATTSNVEALGITKAMPYNGSPETTLTNYTCSFTNPEKVPENDGVFRINVNAQDMAGNSDQQELLWSVNRFGSTYVINSETEPMLNNYVNNDSVKDVIVTEINPSGLESSNVDLSKGTSINTLKENDDYTTESKGGDNSWFEKTYTIKKSIFNEDGKYQLNIYSKDKAGNTNENTMEDKNQDRTGSANIQFVLDNIKPTCNFENLEDSEYYETNHNASSLFEDNTKKFNEAKIVIDGVEQYVSGEDLEKSDFKINFNIKESSVPHTVSAYATDKAGNVMEYYSKNVVVTNNPILYWFYNTPLFIGTLVLLALIIGAVVYLVYRKKKLKNEKID